MPGFYATGIIEPSRHGRSYRVYAIDDNGKRIFIGFVSRKAVTLLLEKRILSADICRYSDAQQTPLNFSMETVTP